MFLLCIIFCDGKYICLYRQMYFSFCFSENKGLKIIVSKLFLNTFYNTDAL